MGLLRFWRAVDGGAGHEPDNTALADLVQARDAVATDFAARQARESEDLRRSIDLIEADVSTALQRVRDGIEGARQISTASAEDLDEIHRSMGSLRHASADASRNVADLAQASEEVAVNVEQVTRNVMDARGRIDAAARTAGDATIRLAELVKATREITGIVETIAAVARQTNLLALNATIEAARAGDAGRGFAVVAHEVKALSVATSGQVNDIRERVALLERTSAETVSAIEAIVALVGDVTPMVGAISTAMEEQARSAAELSHRAQGAASFIETVGGRVEDVDRAALAATTRSRQAADIASVAAHDATALEQRFVPVIRQAGFADRRRHDRYPVEIPVEISVRGRTWPSATIDISLGGLLVHMVDGVTCAKGEQVSVVAEQLGRVEGRVVAISVLGWHIALAQAGTHEGLSREVDRLTAEYQPLIGRAQTVARDVASAMEALVARGTLTEAALFDTTCTPIEGSNPPQFTTVSLPALQRVLPAILEPPLANDNRLVFCLAIDRNGYIPVHNAIYSKPQRPGDVVWNTANCRDRRIFDDRTGIIAARSMRSFVVQSYRRDMGGGQFIVMREVDAPISVLGQHWGGVRMAYRF